ncbi:MAG: hypothetical protein IPO88_29915 [Nannocystis sp.]|uniref:DUF6929 family protein n=1 Tax=Nannocystis sp. TaxID=1962667 RepID=UPI002427984D|nr:hypothetical protein [Nannocystis sp.]MBK9757650.1 hypothetical protein [Nannocystis sp.]
MGPTLLRSLPVSAASGLVRLGAVSYIVADDELTLLACPDHGPDARLTLLPGELPEAHAARKAHKPDFEALCRWPGDGLLALGSGSAATRHRACLVRHVLSDMSSATVEVLDLGPLHAELARHFPALNLEGAAIIDELLLLLQRGNGPGNHNAIVELDLAGAVAATTAGRPWTGALVQAIRRFELGDRGGAALGFTDASPLPDGSLLYIAAAEASPDTYHDGVVTGAAIGRLDPQRRLQWQVELPGPHKLEGVHAEQHGDRLTLWLVNDPDDRSVPASLLHARMDPRTGAWR